jgi:hydroxyacylglutathione hydrolase
LVGSAGRTDLLGPARTDELTGMQFRTMRRLAELPDAIQVLPTHGAGSFCVSGSGGGRRTSTMGDERRDNLALITTDERRFFQEQLSGLPDYPAYYPQMAPINRNGPRTLGKLPQPPALDVESFASRIERGEVWIVDARSREEFAAAHIPGAVNVGLDDSFGSYVGWVLPFNAPMVLVLPEDEVALDEAVVQLIRIGFERIDGYLKGGMRAWTGAERTSESYPIATVDELCTEVSGQRQPHVLDVRQQGEWEAGHLEGSQHLFLGDLAKDTRSVPADRESWIICQSGYRSSIAASLLARTGRSVRLVHDGGVQDLLERCGAAREA